MTTTSQHTARMKAMTVGQVAEEFGITVRTLHHYDTVGLLTPSERTHAGYRLYTRDDMERLARIVTYRRLGFALEDIADLLDGDEDATAHLRRQRDAVMTRIGELDRLVDAIDAALEREMTQTPATNDDLKAIFGDGFNEEYQTEAQERWGETDAWKQSASRTKGYTKADWEEVKAEGDAVNAAFVTAKQAGYAAGSPEAMAAAEQHRLHIHERFYEVSYDFHRELADMYVADPRFTTTYEDMEPGLAQYVHDAIHANAARHD